MFCIFIGKFYIVSIFMCMFYCGYGYIYNFILWFVKFGIYVNFWCCDEGVNFELFSNV